MKRVCMLSVLALFAVACEKNGGGGFTKVKDIELNIYFSIQDYREENKLTGPFVHQLIMVTEAQVYSYKMANGAQALDTTGLTEHWATLHEKIGGYNDKALVLKTTEENENAILNQMLQQPGADSILLSDVTQCGIGVEYDTAGTAYVTVMLMKIDD